MSLFQIILKQLRQRSLTTILTVLSVALGVGLATAILIVQREGDKLFGQSEFGFDVIAGPKGSKLQLVLNNVYQVSEAQSTIPYYVYTDMASRLRREVQWAIPVATGDTYRGFKLLATQPKIFETPELKLARQQVQDEFAQTRKLIEPLANPRQTLELPVAPNSPLLPQLFSLQQELESLGNVCAAFDPEIKYLLDQASTHAATLVDLLATSQDRDSVIKTAQAVVDKVGGAFALVGGPIEPRPGHPFVFAQGQRFAVDKFECVVGSEAAENLGLKLGDAFQASHGASDENEKGSDHAEKWTVVGILSQSDTAFDRVILIPLTGFFAIPAHGDALGDMAKKVAEYRAQQDGGPAVPSLTKPEPATSPATQEAHDEHHDHAYHLEDGRIVLEVPREQWKINSILVRSRGGQPAMSIIWDFNQNPDAMAVSPATEMREFTRTFLRGSSLILLMLAILVSVVAAVSILVSIYNSIAARRREIAILRALGATRKRILSIICLEAGLIGLIGSVIGVMMGISIAAIASVALDRAMGQPFNWASLGWLELLYFIWAIALAVVAGLVPALKAYSTSVADNLVGE